MKYCCHTLISNHTRTTPYLLCEQGNTQKFYVLPRQEHTCSLVQLCLQTIIRNTSHSVTNFTYFSPAVTIILSITQNQALTNSSATDLWTKTMCDTYSFTLSGCFVRTELLINPQPLSPLSPVQDWSTIDRRPYFIS